MDGPATAVGGWLTSNPAGLTNTRPVEEYLLLLLLPLLWLWLRFGESADDPPATPGCDTEDDDATCPSAAIPRVLDSGRPSSARLAALPSALIACMNGMSWVG